jgi:hypothetical protein
LKSNRLMPASIWMVDATYLSSCASFRWLALRCKSPQIAPRGVVDLRMRLQGDLLVISLNFLDGDVDGP